MTLKAGCYIEGSWGQYAVARMVGIAEQFGFEDVPGSQLIDIARRHVNRGDVSDEEFEYLLDSADEVEQWLNDNVAPEGHFFEWVDGEFFLSPLPCDFDDCDGEVVYRDDHRRLCERHYERQLEDQAGYHDGCDH